MVDPLSDGSPSTPAGWGYQPELEPIRIPGHTLGWEPIANAMKLLLHLNPVFMVSSRNL